MNFLPLLVKFLAAGSIVVGVTLLAQKVDPRYGGILAAAPITTPLAFIVMYTEAGRSATRELVLNAFYFAIPTVLFLIVLWFLLEKTGFSLALGGAFLFWIITIVAVNGVIGHGR